MTDGHRTKDEEEIVFKRLMLLLSAALACAVLAAGCGGGDDGGGGGGGGAGATGETEQTAGAKIIDPASMDAATGEVTYCTGKDTSGDLVEGVELLNERFGPDGLDVKLLEFPESADEQRNQFIQRQRANSADCDVFEADVVWTAEFATQKWLYDLTPYLARRESQFVPSTLESTAYEGKQWGVPHSSDAGLLYYRSDQVDALPETWQAVYADAAAKDGIVYQGAAYEGLTVDFLELAFAAGGRALSEDGTEVLIDSPENLRALEFMVDGIGTAAPKAVTTSMEEEARRAFEAGRATYMRNWPYAYALGNKQGSRIRGKFEVAPYPPFEGGETGGVLGGHNMVISANSANPGGALKVIDFFSSPEMMERAAVEYSKTPVLSDTFEDPDVQRALPFADELRQAIEQASSRPVSPVYTQISQAIYKNVNAALAGEVSPAEALATAESDMEQALETF